MLLWHNWNSSTPGSLPTWLDCSLSELASDPAYPSLEADGLRQWLQQCQLLGIAQVELAQLETARDTAELWRWLQTLAAAPPAASLVLSLGDSCPFPTSLLQWLTPRAWVQGIRWLLPTQPEFPAARLQLDLSGPSRLRDLGFEVTLVLSNLPDLHPLRLSGWLEQMKRAGFSSLELVGRGGSPAGAGIQGIFQFCRGLLGEEAQLSWSSDHGFGLALGQALEAIQAGASRVRGSLYGVGLRGNIPLDLLLVNGHLPQLPPEMRGLNQLKLLAQRAFDLHPPYDYPVFGRDAFRSGDELVASACLLEAGAELAEALNSGVPASCLGQRAVIEVGPWSGAANLKYWLERHGLESDPALIEAMLLQLRHYSKPLIDLELIDLYSSCQLKKSDSNRALVAG